MRYTLFYTNHNGKKRFMDGWRPVKESVDFKTLREALSYFSILSEEDQAYIYDNVTKTIVKPFMRMSQKQ